MLNGLNMADFNTSVDPPPPHSRSAILLFTARQRCCRKVMFSQACVCRLGEGYPWSQVLSGEVSNHGSRSLLGMGGYVQSPWGGGLSTQRGYLGVSNHGSRSLLGIGRYVQRGGLSTQGWVPRGCVLTPWQGTRYGICLGWVWVLIPATGT